ncbi:outer kinetochore KNL1 complex subunit ZWINT [Rhinophrynus dorsalis]
MEQTAARLLETLSSIQCLDERNREEGDGEAPAKILVDYSMERLRKQKMLCGQLQVLRLMLEFLQQADTASWDETSPKILSLEVEEAKKNWKKLKAEYQERVKEVQGILPQLLQRVQLLHQKKRDLEESLKRYQSRVSRAQHMERDNLTTSREKVVTDVLLENKTKQKLQELHGQVENQQMVVKKCHDQIQKLEEEMQRLEESATSWIQTVSRDSTLCNLLQTLHGVSLVSVGDKEIVLDLDVGDKGETPPLRVTLHWTSQGNLNVESDVPLPSLPQELLDGAASHVTPVILELQSWYRSQTPLLRELGELQKRKAVMASAQLKEH